MSGSVANTQGAKVCPSCAGKGVLGKPPQAQTCPTCMGAGIVSQEPIRIPWDLVMPNAVLTANQSGLVVTQQLDQDADLEILDYVANSTGTYSFSLLDPSTGRTLSNAAVNGENGAGTAQLPRRLMEPYIWAKSSVIKITFNDRSGSGNTVQFVFSGFKLFPKSNPAQGSAGAIVSA